MLTDGLIIDVVDTKCITMDRRKQLKEIFIEHRIELRPSTLLLLPYFPLGCFIALLRSCLLLNFLIARLTLQYVLSVDNVISRKITRLFMLILGISVRIQGIRMPVDVVVCNKRSSIDGFIIGHIVNIFVENEWDVPSFIHPLFQLCVTRKKGGKGPTAVVFPEKYASTGQGIVQFDEAFFQNVSSAQPATISYWRPFSISMTTVSSGIFSDLFWMFFTPFTTATISLNHECVFQHEDNSVKEYSDEVMRRISEMSGVPVLPISVDDAELHVMRLRNPYTTIIPPRILKMSRKVREVVPHVPENVIIADLKKTNCVDTTLANIFEGIVEYVPICSDTSSQNQVKSTRQYTALTPFEKKKAEMLDAARKSYREKHGL